MLFDSGRGALESSQERFGSSGNGLILPKTTALGATSDIPRSCAAVGHGPMLQGRAVVSTGCLGPQAAWVGSQPKPRSQPRKTHQRPPLSQRNRDT